MGLASWNTNCNHSDRLSASFNILTALCRAAPTSVLSAFLISAITFFLAEKDNFLQVCKYLVAASISSLQLLEPVAAAPSTRRQAEGFTSNKGLLGVSGLLLLELISL